CIPLRPFPHQGQPSAFPCRSSPRLLLQELVPLPDAASLIPCFREASSQHFSSSLLPECNIPQPESSQYHFPRLLRSVPATSYKAYPHHIEGHLHPYIHYECHNPHCRCASMVPELPSRFP